MQGIKIYLRFEGTWVAIQTLLDWFLSLFFMRQIIEAIVAIAIITKLSISKTITISEMKMKNHETICPSGKWQ